MSMRGDCAVPLTNTGGGAIFAHVKCKPGKSVYFEEWVAYMVRNTETEPLCTRYEFWRATGPDSYVVMECFSDANGFFVHRASPYHVAFGLAMKDLDVIESMHLEWVDPAKSAHAQLPLTTDTPLPPGAPTDVELEKRRFPVRVPPWWVDLR
jgi:quinol monooxygenase YgiN